MRESSDELLNRLILKYNEELQEVECPKDFVETCKKFKINEELGLKFLVLSTIDPTLQVYPLEARFAIAVSDGLYKAKNRFGSRYELKRDELDVEKIIRRIRQSAQQFKTVGINLPVETLFKSTEYSVWWKSMHFPILREYGWFDEKIKTLLHEYEIGRWAKREYDNAMYPYDLRYWIMKGRQDVKRRAQQSDSEVLY